MIVFMPFVEMARLFIIFWKWVLENHRGHRGHRENSNSLCPPCPLWLIFFAIIRVHPEKIKKSRNGCLRPPGRGSEVVIESI